ncbi:hypothetical protein PG988_000319 [Apiospora saccharicola]
MCDYTQAETDLAQVEYSCGHFRFRVQRWCAHYERTHRSPADCRPHKPAPWEHMIRRTVRAGQYA